MMRVFSVFVSLLVLSPLVWGDGLPVQYGLLPLGDLTTQDQDGPYNIPDVQAAEVEAAIAAKTGAPGGPFTDADVLNFLANTECLEATFNTFAAFGAGLPASLLPTGVIGGKKAPLTPEVQSWAEEVALDEQGHVRMVRQVLGSRSVPCPTLDLSGGFRAYIDAATGIKSTPPFDPFKNDVNFLLATFSLEEIGATGDKGCILLASNPGVANCIAGLAGAASYQSGIDRHFLWQRRNETVPEYNMTVHQIVESISNIRDVWDGLQSDVDQALYQGNPNFISPPSGNINLVPTDIRGLTFSRTPQQVLRIVTLGSETGKGGFFPEGLNGKINSPVGFNVSANAYGGYPDNKVVVRSLAELNKTALLGANLTNVTAAPIEVQSEASGQQYNATGAGGVGSAGSAPNGTNGGNSPSSTTLIGTAAPNAGSSAPNAGGSGNTTGQNEAGPASGNGTANAPTGTDASNGTTGGAGNGTSTAAPAGADAGNATTGAAGTGNDTAGGNGTTPAAVVVVPVTTALNQTSTNDTALNASSPAFTSTAEASPSPAGANGTSPSPAEGAATTAESPSPAEGNATGASPAASPAPGGENGTTGGVAVVPVPVVVVAPGAASPAPSASPEASPAAGTTATSPAPAEGSPATGTTTSPAPAAEGTSPAPGANPTDPSIVQGSSAPGASPAPGATTTSPAPGGENATAPSAGATGVLPVVVPTGAPLPGAEASSPAPAAGGATPAPDATATTASPAPGSENGTAAGGAAGAGGATASPAPAAGSSPSPGDANTTIAAAITDVPVNATNTTVQAIEDVVSNATNGTVDITVGTGPSPSPAAGARKLRFWRRPAV